MKPENTPAYRERVIVCNDCPQQRHAPRVPEAFRGWVRSVFGGWLCPDCKRKRDGKAKAKAQ